MESENLYDADELGQYQSLSTAAIVALVLGLLSPIAFFSTLLVLVPLLALAVACWALVKIKSSEGGLQGTRLAYCGLMLAIVFGVASVARTQVRVEILRRQASESAERWLAMLARGQAEDALGLMTGSAISKLSDSDQGNATAPIPTVPIFGVELGSAQLLQDPLAAALIERHESGKATIFQCQGNLVYDLPKPRAMLYYQMPNAKDSLFFVSLVKSVGHQGLAVWLIDAWKTEEVTLP